MMTQRGTGERGDAMPGAAAAAAGMLRHQKLVFAAETYLSECMLG
jgi:hypothetical protein